MSKYINCGNTQGGQSADSYEVQLTIQTVLQAADAGTTRVLSTVSADGRFALSGGEDASVRLWDLSTLPAPAAWPEKEPVPEAENGRILANTGRSPRGLAMLYRLRGQEGTARVEAVGGDGRGDGGAGRGLPGPDAGRTSAAVTAGPRPEPGGSP